MKIQLRIRESKCRKSTLRRISGVSPEQHVVCRPLARFRRCRRRCSRCRTRCRARSLPFLFLSFLLAEMSRERVRGDLSGMICGRVVASPDDDPEYTSASTDAIAGYDAEYSLAARNLSAAPSIRDRGALIF